MIHAHKNWNDSNMEMQIGADNAQQYVALLMNPQKLMQIAF